MVPRWYTSETRWLVEEFGPWVTHREIRGKAWLVVAGHGGAQGAAGGAVVVQWRWHGGGEERDSCVRGREAVRESEGA